MKIINSIKEIPGVPWGYLRRYLYTGRYRDPGNRRNDSKEAAIHVAAHRKNPSETEYRKPGATHWGAWYDEPTGPWPILVARS